MNTNITSAGMTSLFGFVMLVAFGTANAQNSSFIEEENQLAASRSCSFYCQGPRGRDDYDNCISDCQSNNRASAEQPTMLADGGCYQQDDGSVICYGEDGSVIQQSDAAVTQFASLKSPGYNSLCDTDPFSCFHVPNQDNTLSNDARIVNVQKEETQQAFLPIIIYCILQCTSSK